MKRMLMLKPVVLTKEQCARYELPLNRNIESERRADAFKANNEVEGATELDALEAYIPASFARFWSRKSSASCLQSSRIRGSAPRWPFGRELAGVEGDVLAEHEAEREALQERYDAIRAELEAFKVDLAAHDERRARGYGRQGRRGREPRPCRAAQAE